MKKWLVLSVVVLFIPLFSTPPPPSRAQARPQAVALCPALPLTGNVVHVSTVAQLQSAVNGASAGDTILIADGTYNLDGVYLRVDTPHVTLRSASGDREAVRLDGNYLTTEIVQVVASDVTIADLTLREAYDHPIHVITDGDDTLNTLIYNVHIVDPGQQAIKINPGTSGGYPDGGTVACSHIELTGAGRPHIRDNCYTGGIDAHQARDWTVRDNTIDGFWCASGLSEHGIHFWRGCRDPVVERNVLRNNARGIGFGLATSGDGRTYPDDPCPGASGYVDHFGGIVRNNIVFANDGGLFGSQYGFDCGICLWNACGPWVGHNTVASTQAPFSGIEWRFPNTDVDLVNNLLTHNLMDRDGLGTARLSNNREDQPLSLFVDGAGGDLHLVSTAAAAIDQGAAVGAWCSDDVDGQSRPAGPGFDIGADEYRAPVPETVFDLHIVSAITDTTTLTATLAWTPPADAITTSLRYAVSPIYDVPSWQAATVLDDALPGHTSGYLAVVPFAADGTVYFALITQNESGLSAVSGNNAFWPHWDLFLPLVSRRWP